MLCYQRVSLPLKKTAMICPQRAIRGYATHPVGYSTNSTLQIKKAVFLNGTCWVGCGSSLQIVMAVSHWTIAQIVLYMWQHSAEAESKEKRGVWDSMPELTITSPYVDSKQMYHGQPYARVDFILLQSGTWDLASELTQYFLSALIHHTCAADFSLLNLPKGKSLGRSKPATNS